MASLTRPAAWTEAEQKQLETLARRYPSSEHSLVTQCAKIAAGLPRKSIRDVGARLRLLALDPLATFFGQLFWASEDGLYFTWDSDLISK